APSPATPVPVAEGDTAVTAGQGRVVGRDPRTGEPRWHYARDVPLCTVGAGFSRVHAVYRTGHNCSEVTQLDPGTGQRTAQRTGNAEHGTRLVSGDRHVTTTGDRLLNTWRSDLVKTLEYGRVPAPVNPDRQPRTGCTYGTVATAAERVGVIERCPDESGPRLTVLKAAGEEADVPETEFSKMLPATDAALLALTDEAVAVALPRGEVLVYGMDGMHRATHPVSVPGSELVRDRPDGVVPHTRGRGTVHVFTGSHTLALSADDLTPRWAAEGTLGPGTVFAGHSVVPVRGGLAVINDTDGATLRTVAVDRRAPEAPVRLTAAGPVLLEQRGDTVVALR
ncbi:Rv3212 family protein, partial [Saccharomonospora iraqiensis]|uniref:Rv3212 family protein n=1 Tax=Saccharomonospora iraqiensis TaxID=52698 RepID=UPI00022E11E4